MRIVRAFLVTVLILGGPVAIPLASAQPPTDGSPAAFVRSVINASGVTFAHAKLSVDHFINPSVDVSASLAEIDAMAASIDRMLATLPPEAASTSIERMRALRAFLYESGWWNDHTPFTYDLEDLYGQQPGNRLLSSYLSTRKGNCISMPMLFLILGERLGLDVTLATAPLHVFVKWTEEESGVVYNLETTSGAGATRDIWYRQMLPMTDAAVANGVYMKKLTAGRRSP